MDLLALATGLLALVVLGFAANRWGVDSRDTMNPALPPRGSLLTWRPR